MNFKKFLPIFLFGLALTFTMCSKDDDNDNATPETYVGKWHTNAFAFATTKVIMNFEFTETAFETIITPEGATIPLLGVQGDVAASNTNDLSIKITDLGQVNTSGTIDWYNRYNDEAIFNNIYTQTVSAFMPLDFDATYEITGTQMDLIIPAAQDTIVMFR